MLPVVESIHVLKLRKNDKSELENQLTEKFPGTRINFLEVDGQTVNKNEGSINLSFCQIVNQDYVDEVALDITRNHIEMIKQVLFDYFVVADCKTPGSIVRTKAFV